MLGLSFILSASQVGTLSGQSQRQEVGCQANPTGHSNENSFPLTQLTYRPQSPASLPTRNIPQRRIQFPDSADFASASYSKKKKKIKIEMT